MTRSFFKTRNSRRIWFHVVFLMCVQFRDVRLELRIAKVPFLVTYIHINLLYIRISHALFLLNKISFIRKWRLTRTCIQFEVRFDLKYSPLKMTTLKFLQNGWQDGEQILLSLQSSRVDKNASTINLKCMWLTCLWNFKSNEHGQGHFSGAKWKTWGVMKFVWRKGSTCKKVSAPVK